MDTPLFFWYLFFFSQENDPSAASLFGENVDNLSVSLAQKLGKFMSFNLSILIKQNTIP